MSDFKPTHRVVRNTSFHKFKIDEQVKFITVRAVGSYYQNKNGEKWCLSDEELVPLTQPADGDRVRASFEGIFRNNRIYVNSKTDGLTRIAIFDDYFDDVEVIEPALKLPTEPGSVATLSKDGTSSQAILTGGFWYWLETGQCLAKPIDYYKITSIDRIGV